MTTIKVLQYRADKQDGHWLDDAISGWSKLFTWDTPPHSHSELLLPDGWCFSSTTRDNAKGTRFRLAKNVMRNPDRWDVYEKKVAAVSEKIIRRRAVLIDGRSYSYMGIVGFFTPIGWLTGAISKRLNHWYCSQAVYYCLTGERKRISPRRLTRWMLENGWVKV